jgi:hypothetical protein
LYVFFTVSHAISSAFPSAASSCQPDHHYFSAS